MPLIDKPISERAGYREDFQAGEPDALQRELIGCMLVQFPPDYTMGVSVMWRQYQG